MFKKIIKISTILLGLTVLAPSFAADPAPLALLKDISGRMLVELNKNISTIKHNDRLVYNLVDRICVPHFDLLNMSRAVVGRNYWQQASESMQQQFIKEFTRYVIRTYASAMQSYDGETVKFYPIRGAVTNPVQINSDLLLKNGPSIQMQYRMSLQSGKWVIYDFSVDGVSIIKNYNSQFAGDLRQSGLNGLVVKLRKNNSRA